MGIMKNISCALAFDMNLEDIAKALPHDMLVEIYKRYLQVHIPRITEIWLKIPNEIHKENLEIEINGRTLPIKYDRSDSDPDYGWYRVFPEDLTIQGTCFPRVCGLIDYSNWYYEFECDPLLYSDDLGYTHGAIPSLKCSICSGALPLRFRSKLKISRIIKGDFCLFFDLPEEYVAPWLP